MAKSRWNGTPIARPTWPRAMHSSNAPTLTDVGAASAIGSVGATDRLTIVGSILWADGEEHDCDTIHWRSGSVTAASFTLRVSLRDIDAANGPPGRDDGTADQSGTHVNPTATTDFTTALSAARTLAHGARVALTFDFSAYTSGSMRVPAGQVASVASGSLPVTFFNGTTYTLVTGIVPAITFEADDGTFGIFSGGLPRISAITATAYANDDTPDERGLAFTVAEPQWGGSFGFLVNPAAGADFDIVLYEGTTEKAKVSFDANTWGADGSPRWFEANFPDVAFVTGQTYYVVVKPTTTSDVTIYVLTLTTGHLPAFAALGGYATRTDAGAWAAVADTQLPVAYIGIAAGNSGGGVPRILTGLEVL